MLNLTFGILIRILSNSYLNVLQKLLTKNNESPSSVNFYSYLGLSIISLIAIPNLIFNKEILAIAIVMGLLGSLGNYYIIKALSCGELSTLAPINSYKPIVALIWGIILLNEIPGIKQIFAILLIILGTIILTQKNFILSKAFGYRILALILSGTEAIFIKKIIILTNLPSAFLYWSFAGLAFSILFINKDNLKLKKFNIKYQIYLILMIFLMQYSTNYVFEKIHVSYALALFQLSTILNVFLGINIFKEKGLLKKLIASIIMIIGATLLILYR